MNGFVLAVAVVTFIQTDSPAGFKDNQEIPVSAPPPSHSNVLCLPIRIQTEIYCLLLECIQLRV